MECTQGCREDCEVSGRLQEGECIAEQGRTISFFSLALLISQDLVKINRGILSDLGISQKMSPNYMVWDLRIKKKVLKCICCSWTGRTKAWEEMSHLKDEKERMLIGCWSQGEGALYLEVLQFIASRVEKWSKTGWHWFQKKGRVKRCFQDEGSGCAKGK